MGPKTPIPIDTHMETPSLDFHYWEDKQRVPVDGDEFTYQGRHYRRDNEQWVQVDTEASMEVYMSPQPMIPFHQYKQLEEKLEKVVHQKSAYAREYGALKRAAQHNLKLLERLQSGADGDPPGYGSGFVTEATHRHIVAEKDEDILKLRDDVSRLQDNNVAYINVLKEVIIVLDLSTHTPIVDIPKFVAELKERADEGDKVYSAGDIKKVEIFDRSAVYNNIQNLISWIRNARKSRPSQGLQTHDVGEIVIRLRDIQDKVSPGGES